MKTPLLILVPLPEPIQTELETAFECLDATHGEKLEACLKTRSVDIRALVGNGGSEVQRSLLERLPNLELVTICGVGYDGVDVAACRERGVRVTNTPDVLTDDVADLALALVLMTARRLMTANRFLHAGDWLKGPSPLASALAGKTAGIVGLGRIGTAIARRLKVSGMQICYHGRTRQQVDYPFHADLREMAAAVDFLIVICPGGPATRHLVSEEILCALGPQGTLINVARGSVVDEEAMTSLLQSGGLGAVGLDVFADEPRVPQTLLDHPNAVLLPHVGSATVETRAAMGRLCLDNVTAHFAGRPLLTPVV